jgi:HEAT repeat protein/beta-lactamase regulating signal transducer with metallopeptidase domain
MNVMETLLAQPSVAALGRALLHFTWQGSLVALLLAGALRVFRSWSTGARYGAACCAMILMTAAPVVTMAVLSRPPRVESAGGPYTLVPARTVSPEEGIEIDPSGHMTRGNSAPFTMQGPKPGRSAAWSAAMAPLLPWTTVVWLLGVTFFSLRFGCAWGYAQRLRSRGVRALDGRWQGALRRLCRQLRVTRPVRLLESGLVRVPMAVGWLRPVILLPAGALTGLTAGQLEAIIAHELAHVRRHDYLVNVLQSVVETLLFYHPAVWWVSGRIRHERELCCDDLAVAVCGDPLAYARALLEMEQLRAAGPQLAVAANGGTLMNRIQRLVKTAPQPADRFAGLFVGAITMIALVSLGVGAQILNPPSKIDGPGKTARQSASARTGGARAGDSDAASQGAGAGRQSGPSQDTRAAEALLESLRNADREVRMAAVESLAQVPGGRAVELLISAAMQDVDRQVRERAAAALGVHDDGRSADALMKMMADSVWQAHEQAASGLRHQDDARAAEALQKALQDSAWQAQEQASRSLGVANQQQSADLLINSLIDRNAQGREAAAKSLGEIDDYRKAEALFRASQDQDDQMRKKAADALENHYLYQKDLYESIKRKAYDDAGRMYYNTGQLSSGLGAMRDGAKTISATPFKYVGLVVRNGAATAILRSKNDDGRIFNVKDGETFEGHWRVVKITPQRVEIVDTENGVTQAVESEGKGPGGAQGNPDGTASEHLKSLSSPNPVDRAAGACALGRLGAVESIPALVNLLGDDAAIPPMKCWGSGNWSPALHTFKQSSPGEQAAIALASFGQRAADPLVAALASANSGARRNAAWAIGEIRGGREANRSAAVEPLIAAMSDGDPWVRVAAAFSLGEMRPHQATETLVAALGDGDWRVREMAARALGEMTSRSGVESLTGILLRDENERVRRKAAWALGEIKDARALDALNVALNDQDQRVRSTARQAISEIRD